MNATGSDAAREGEAPSFATFAYKVGWLFEGGGAKGSFSFAVAEKLLDKGVPVDAVSGTSVGALNALLLGTGQMARGRILWDGLKQSDVLPFRVPLLGRVSLLLAVPHMFLWFLSGRRAWVDPAPVRRWAETAILFLLVSPALIGVAHFLWTENSWLRFFALLPAFGIMAVCYRAPAPDYPPRDFAFVHSTVRVLGLMMLTFTAATGAYRLVVAAWNGHDMLAVASAMPALVAAMAVLLIIVGALLISRFTATDSGPLKGVVSEIAAHALTCPVHVTMAQSLHILDPDFPQSALLLRGPDEPPLYQHVSSRLHVPRYLRLNDLDAETRTLAAVASASLPFGIADATRVGGIEYVDGGVADNTPIRPLIDVEQCDVILWFGLNPEENIPAEHDHQTDHPEPNLHWQRCWRKEDVSAWTERYEPAEEQHPESLPSQMRVPWRELPKPFPQVIKILPPEHLGDLLDLSPEVLAHRTALGRETADEFVAQYGKWLEALIFFRAEAAAAHAASAGITQGSG